jgi:hypothetical protein
VPHTVWVLSYSYGQSTLTHEQRQAFMEWLFAYLMNTGYFGKAHFIRDDSPDREREMFTALPHIAGGMLCLRLKFVQVPLNRSLINHYFRLKTLVSS